MIRAILRRSPTVAATILATILGGLLLSLAHAIHLPLLPLGMGLVCGAVLAILMGWARRRKRAARGPRPPRPQVLAGGRLLTGSYDLAKDKSTDGQRWLM